MQVTRSDIERVIIVGWLLILAFAFGYWYGPKETKDEFIGGIVSAYCIDEAKGSFLPFAGKWELSCQARLGN